jgi:competence protein ComEA
MNLIDKFNHYFGFTKNESRIILFLTATFLFGLILKFANVSFQPQQEYDYSESDSIFAVRSRQLVFDSADASMSDADSLKRHNASDNKAQSSSIVNINTASKNDLVNLPGIGNMTAERIIQYRNEHGPFKTIEDLQNVKGIGMKKFERIAPFVKVK